VRRAAGLPERLADAAIVIFAFFLTNLRALVYWPLFPDTSKPTGLAWVEVGLWAIPLGLMGWVLTRDGLLGSYACAWRRNWLLTVFIILAVASVFYSVSPSASVYRVCCLLFASLIGAYLGVRYNPQRLLILLFTAGAVAVIMSFATVLILPIAGKMLNWPYDGAWRGIFWHKNHLGSIAALLNAVFLFRIIDGWARRRAQAAVAGVFYGLSMVLIYQAESAAGVILAILLHLLIAGTVLWRKLRVHLRPVHYIVAAGVGGLCFVFTVSNLELVLGLFNRTPMLTGRVPLWIFLLQDVFSHHPWVGHGFGAIWTSESFRVSTQEVVGWGYPVMQSDNGFVDILLHIGVVGLALFTGALLVIAVRSCKYAVTQRTLDAFFLPILLVYSFAANITWGLFLETESFVWLLIIAVAFMVTTQHDKQLEADENGQVRTTEPARRART
jgi:exopolysaccharide production protein ExoQ